MVINFVIFGLALAMVTGIILFVLHAKRTDNKLANVLEEDNVILEEDKVVLDYCCGENCCEHSKKNIPIMITIKSLDRVKGKTKQWLLIQGLSKAQVDIILSDINIPFDASEMDLLTAPFEYTGN